MVTSRAEKKIWRKSVTLLKQSVIKCYTKKMRDFLSSLKRRGKKHIMQSILSDKKKINFEQKHVIYVLKINKKRCNSKTKTLENIQIIIEYLQSTKYNNFRVLLT